MEEEINKIKEEAIKNNIPILQAESLKLIETIFEIKKPRKVLEIGTAVGYSAINFSKHLNKKNSKIITLEIDESLAKIARDNIAKVEQEGKIEVVCCDANTYLETLSETFDIVFIDAAKGQYMKYLEQAMRLTRKGSIIIADNVLFKGMVMGGYNEHKHRTAVTRLREYIKEVTTNDNLQSIILDVGDGVAISVKK